MKNPTKVRSDDTSALDVSFATFIQSSPNAGQMSK